MRELVPVSQIVADQDIQPRVHGLNSNHVLGLKETPNEWPPLTCLPTGDKYLLIDGFHRYEAALQLGLEKIEVEIVQNPSNGDLGELAFRANLCHGFPLTLEDKRARALYLINTDPSLSDREIGRRVALSHTTISKLRPKPSPGQHQPQSTSERRAEGELPECNALVNLNDTIESVLKPAKHKPRRIVRYLQRLAVALNDQFNLDGWESGSQVAGECIQILGQDEASQLASIIGPPLINTLDVATELGYDPDIVES